MDIGHGRGSELRARGSPRGLKEAMARRGRGFEIDAGEVRGGLR